MKKTKNLTPKFFKPTVFTALVKEVSLSDIPYVVSRADTPRPEFKENTSEPELKKQPPKSNL